MSRLRAAVIAAGLAFAGGAALQGTPALAVGLALTLNPSSGTPQSAFTATVRYPHSGTSKCLVEGQKASFSFDGAAVGSALVDSECSASISLRPPLGSRNAGTHTVTATIGALSASATYKIIAATHSPTPTPGSPTPKSPSPSASSKSPTPLSTDTFDPVPIPSNPSDSPSPAVIAAPPGRPVGNTAASDGGSHIWPLLIFGLGALLVLGVAGFAVWKLRTPDDDPGGTLPDLS